jgi:cytochrome c-type biogenesis protein CcmH/NrfG
VEAERSLRNAIALDPENSLALANLAILREKAGDRAEALALYERALRVEPTDDFARRKVAELQPTQPARGEAK